MGTDAPTIVFIPVHCTPKKAHCPKCGKLGKRKRTCTREVRTVACKAVAYLKITYGEYTAQCANRQLITYFFPPAHRLQFVASSPPAHRWRFWRSLTHRPEPALPSDSAAPTCQTTPAGNRQRPLCGGSHERRTDRSSSRHYPAPRRAHRQVHLRRRRPIRVWFHKWWRRYLEYRRRGSSTT